MHTRAMRVLRGSMAATFATLAAALSHQVAGGVPPSLFGVGVSLLISITICTLLAGRTVSFMRLSIAIVASQAMFHTLFSAMLAPAGVATHDMSAMSLDFASTAQAANSAMSLSHIAAALVTILMFRYAEVAFWGLLITARLFVRRLLSSVRAVVLNEDRVSLALHSCQVPTLSTRFLSTMRYRGPPLATIAA